MLAAVLPLLAWSVHNGVRFDSWGLARGGNAIVPFYRAFITDHIVSPENGEESRRLAAAMQQHLLTREPYRSYGVTLDQLFREGSFRSPRGPLPALRPGLRLGLRLPRPARRRHRGCTRAPGTYAQGVARTIWDELAKAQFRAVSSGDETQPRLIEPSTVVIGGKRLPAPTEGEPIPWGRSSGSRGPTQHPAGVDVADGVALRRSNTPRTAARFDEIQREVDDSSARSPTERATHSLALRLNQLSRWYPRPWMWILLGLIGGRVASTAGLADPRASALAAFAVVLLNALGLFADLHFVLPVAPAFILLGMGGLLGARGFSPQ